MSQTLTNFINAILKGSGQVMLQENRLTGLLFLAGVFIGGWQMGVGAVIALLIATLTAMLLNFDKTKLSQGLYGFSACLVGIAVAMWFGLTLPSVVLIIAGSAMATVLQEGFFRRNIPVFTLPFILVAWAIYAVAEHGLQLPHIVSTLPHFLTKVGDTLPPITMAVLNGFGQVMFQGNVLSGLLFLLGILLNSRVQAGWALLGSLAGAGMAYGLGLPIDNIVLGLFGYNMVLSCIVFAGYRRNDLILLIITMLVTFILSWLLPKLAIFSSIGGVLTLPFVLGVWVTMAFKNVFQPLNKV